MTWNQTRYQQQFARKADMVLLDIESLEKGKMHRDGFHKAERDRKRGEWQVYNELSTTLALRSRFALQEKLLEMKKHGPFELTETGVDLEQLKVGWNRAIDTEMQSISGGEDSESV